MSAMDTLGQFKGDNTAKFNSIQTLRVNQHELEKLINIQTHSQNHQKLLLGGQKEILYEVTPDTCRQTSGPISATLIHNTNSVSAQSASGVNYYYPRTNS